MVRHVALQGKPPFFFYSAEFSALFSGVSYVRPVPLHFNHTRVDEAITLAREVAGTVLNAQTYGPKWKGGKNGSYNLQSWLNCGFTLDNFNDNVNYPLVFDLRDPEREAFLAQRHIKTTLPLIVLALGCGKSSPFNGAARLADAIKAVWVGKCEIVDLCKVKGGRLYDLLGLMDRAKVIVATDSAPLHLAAASDTPVIALVNDNPWLATMPRCNVAYKLCYGEWLSKVREIHGVISKLV